MASTQEGEKQGILVEIAKKKKKKQRQKKKTERASLEPSENIRMVFMAIVKVIRVKDLRLSCCVIILVFTWRDQTFGRKRVFHSQNYLQNLLFA